MAVLGDKEEEGGNWWTATTHLCARGSVKYRLMERLARDWHDSWPIGLLRSFTLAIGVNFS